MSQSGHPSLCLLGNLLVYLRRDRPGCLGWYHKNMQQLSAEISGRQALGEDSSSYAKTAWRAWGVVQLYTVVPIAVAPRLCQLHTLA